MNGHKRPGNYEMVFDGSGLSPGIYYCKININGYQVVKKMII
jgi:hypothetical protein